MIERITPENVQEAFKELCEDNGCGYFTKFHLTARAKDGEPQKYFFVTEHILKADPEGERFYSTCCKRVADIIVEDSGNLKIVTYEERMVFSKSEIESVSYLSDNNIMLELKKPFESYTKRYEYPYDMSDPTIYSQYVSFINPITLDIALEDCKLLTAIKNSNLFGPYRSDIRYFDINEHSRMCFSRDTRYAVTDDKIKLIALTEAPYNSDLNFGGSVNVGYLNEIKVVGCHLRNGLLGRNSYIVDFIIEM